MYCDDRLTIEENRFRRVEGSSNLVELENEFERPCQSIACDDQDSPEESIIHQIIVHDSIKRK